MLKVPTLRGSARFVPVAALMTVAAVATGCSGRRPSAMPQVDPAMRVVFTVMALERTDLPLTKEQAEQLVPLFRILRGVPATDRRAVETLVRQIETVLTDAQRTAVRRLREQPRPGGPGAPDAPPAGRSRPGPGQPGAEGPSAEQMIEFRERILDRAIRLLEDRAR